MAWKDAHLLEDCQVIYVSTWDVLGSRVTLRRPTGSESPPEDAWKAFDMQQSANQVVMAPSDQVDFETITGEEIFYACKLPEGSTGDEGTRLGEMTALIGYSGPIGDAVRFRRYYSTVYDAIAHSHWTLIGETDPLPVGSTLVTFADPGVEDATWVGFRFSTFNLSFSSMNMTNLRQKVVYPRQPIEICNADGSPSETFSFNTRYRGSLPLEGQTQEFRVRNETGVTITVNIRRIMRHTDLDNIATNGLSLSLNEVVKSRFLLSTVGPDSGFVAADIFGLVVPVGGKAFWLRWQPSNEDAGIPRSVGLGSLFLEVL